MSRSILLRMRTFSDKSCRENQNTHFVFNNFFFIFENRAFYEILQNNIVNPGKPQTKIRRTCIAYWIPKAKTHAKICNY